jgi:copper chaperone CopZ
MSKREVLKVSGMHCNSCKMLIEDVLEEIGIKSDATVDKGTVAVEYNEDETGIMDKIRNVIESEGFRVNGSG